LRRVKGALTEIEVSDSDAFCVTEEENTTARAFACRHEASLTPQQ
jgi:hypothetical protein